ncbi:MAG: DUF58 domain-containing protein, partial [Oligoflexia bacterium]|nr:DUF58 domain-containing protein [Oligoflexia bacterium]
IVFLVSDFQGHGHENEIRVTGHRHDLIAISINDPRELELPDIGYIELEDAETGEFILINTSNKKLLKDYKSSAKKNLKQQKDFFQSNGIDFIDINVANSYINPIVQFFKAREVRK